MAKLITVPLDGSTVGEQAFPAAISLAERNKADLEIVHVFEPVPPPYALAKGAPVPDVRLDAELRRDREKYIAGVEQWLRQQGHYNVFTAILEGTVGRALVDHIADRAPDVVVMTTHGRSGLTRLWLGSVALYVAQNSSSPLMLVKPEKNGARTQEPPAFQRVLIPLDGRSDDEAVIDHAIAILGSRRVQFTIVHVMVPLFFANADVGVSYPDEVGLQKAAVGYLEDIASRLRARGLAVDTRLLRSASPANAILECAEDTHADLIAMETHRSGRLTRILAGSVADKVIRGSPIPVLVHSLAAEQTGVAGEKPASEAA